MLYRATVQYKWESFDRKLPVIQGKLRALPDLYMEIQLEITCSVPLVGRLLPTDTGTIATSSFDCYLSIYLSPWNYILGLIFNSVHLSITSIVLITLQL